MYLVDDDIVILQRCFCAFAEIILEDVHDAMQKLDDE